MHHRAFAIVALLIAVASRAYADTVEIRPEVLNTLSREGEVTSFYSETVSVALAPSQSLTERVISEIGQLQPDIGIEALFSYSLPDAIREREDLDRYVYNVMRSFRTMEGIPYYSASRGRMRTFFYDSYVVRNQNDLTPIPDPLVSTIPEVDTITVFQRDSSFGKNTLEVTYNATEGQVLLSMSNLTTMAYRGVLPVVRPENLKMFLYVVRDETKIYFYGNCGVNTYSLFGMEDRAQASFTNRIRALYHWFVDRMALSEGNVHDPNQGAGAD